MRTPKPKAPTIAQERESLLDMETPAVYIPNRRNEDGTITVLAESLERVLRPVNNLTDSICFTGLPGLLPAHSLRDWVPLASDPQLTLMYSAETPRNLPGSTLRFTGKGPMLTITGGTTRTRFLMVPPDKKIAGLIVSINFDPLPERENAIPDEWILRARSKDKAHPELCNHFGDVAADNYRLHYDASIAPWPSRDTQKYREIKAVLALARTAENRALVDAGALTTAAKRCKALKTGKMTITLNGSLEYSAGLEEIGNTHGSITDGYQHAGETVTINVKPALLLEALAPMRGLTRFGVKQFAKGPGVYLSNGTREAVIMCKVD